MTQFKDEVDCKHTTLLNHSKAFTAQATAPLAVVLSQLKLYTAQSIAAEEKKLSIARENLSSISASVVAPGITSLSALLTASSGWSKRVDPPLEVGSIKCAAARATFEAALADAAATITPREAVCEADIPLSALTPGSDAVELGSTELCGVRFRFRAHRGCKTDVGVEGVNTQGFTCEVEAEPVSKALASLYKACGVRARAVDNLVFTDDELSDENSKISSLCDSEDKKSVAQSSQSFKESQKSAALSTLSALDQGKIHCGLQRTTEQPTQKGSDRDAVRKLSNRDDAATSVVLPDSASYLTQFTTVASTFGCVNAVFSVRLIESSNISTDNASCGQCVVWLTKVDGGSKEEANAQAYPNPADNDGVCAASATLSFPALLNE